MPQIYSGVSDWCPTELFPGKFRADATLFKFCKISKGSSAPQLWKNQQWVEFIYSGGDLKKESPFEFPEGGHGPIILNV